jgi:hypothetical protein
VKPDTTLGLICLAIAAVGLVCWILTCELVACIAGAILQKTTGENHE